MLVYLIFFLVQTAHTHIAVNTMRRGTYRRYLDTNNININNKVMIKSQLNANKGGESIDYFNITEFNKFIDKNCPAEVLNVTQNCLKELSDCSELRKKENKNKEK